MKSTWVILVLGAGAVLFGAVFVLRPEPAAPVPPPIPAPAPYPRAARVMDEGSLTRESPEEKFLDQASRGTPANPRPLDPADPQGESRRVLGELRDLFVRMKDLAALHKKTDPARYAAEMSGLKQELIARIHVARTALEKWDVAQEELFRLLREESDAAVQERLAFLLRYAKPEKSSPFLLKMAESSRATDRKVAIQGLGDVRTLEAARCLIQHAAVDAEMELRQHSIVELRKLLAGPSTEAKHYREEGWKAFRQYADPAHPAPVRAAVFEALAQTPSLLPEDRELILKTIRTEKDPAVLKPAQSAYRHLSAREKAISDRASTPSR